MPAHRGARSLITALLVTLGVAGGCGAKDESAMRREEQQRIDSAGRGVKPLCYGALKAALRALPRLALDTNGPIGRTPGPRTRAEWTALVDELAAREPKMKPWRARPGIFAVAVAVARTAHAGGPAGGNALAALSAEPFGDTRAAQAAALGSELASLVADDEDEHPALFSIVLPAAQALADSRGAGLNLARLTEPSVEHLVLALVWIVGQQPELASYEMARVKPAALEPAERVFYHSCRVAMLFNLDAPLTILTELDGLEQQHQKLPPLAPADAAQLERVLAAGRYFALGRLGRWSEAEPYAAGLRAQLADPEKRLAIRILPAAWKVKQGRYLEAVRDVRDAAGAVRDDPELAKRLDALAGELEREVEGAKKRIAEAALEALGGDWMHRQTARFTGLRDAMSARVAEWTAAMPSTESLKSRASSVFDAAAERVKAAVGGASPTASPARR